MSAAEKDDQSHPDVKSSDKSIVKKKPTQLDRIESMLRLLLNGLGLDAEG